MQRPRAALAILAVLAAWAAPTGCSLSLDFDRAYVEPEDTSDQGTGGNVSEPDAEAPDAGPQPPAPEKSIDNCDAYCDAMDTCLETFSACDVYRVLPESTLTFLYGGCLQRCETAGGVTGREVEDMRSEDGCVAWTDAVRHAPANSELAGMSWICTTQGEICASLCNPADTHGHCGLDTAGSSDCTDNCEGLDEEVFGCFIEVFVRAGENANPLTTCRSIEACLP